MSQTFQQMLDTQKVHHSLLLIGATREEAIDLAKQLLGPSHVAKIDSGNHPDLHFYAPEGKGHLHPMANILKLVREVALPPFEAACKVFLIEEGEKMLPSSSNALLKTLEEPNEDSFFLLLSDHPNRLLPTVRSRLRPLSFSRSKTEAIDIAPYIARAQNQEWDLLLEELPEENPQAFFGGCLQWAAQLESPLLFQKIASYIEEAQQALDHNLKPRTVFLHLLVKIEGIHYTR